jgi:dihydroorotate dehydrogenase electron transfer subunit
MPLDVEARILSNQRLSEDYNILGLAAPDIAERVEPGQFLMVKPAGEGEPLLRRPFSVFEVLRDEGGGLAGLSLLVKRVGRATSKLYSAAPGQVLSCLGPLGRPFTVVRPPAEAWMVAGGVGLAPFATLAERLREAGCRSVLFYGARRGADLYALDVFERLGARLVLATEDGSCGVRGLVTQPLAEQLDRHAADARPMIYACGPEPMLRAVAQIAAVHDRPCEISTERVMGCGMGGCFSCVVRVRERDGVARYVRSCTEGPVFRGEDVVWE